MRWVEKYNEEGEIKRHDRPSFAYNVTNEEVTYILDEIKKNKTITMEDLLIKVKTKYPEFNITRRHLSRVVKIII